MLHNADDSEYCQVGCYIDKRIVHQRGDTHCGVAHHSKHDIACLRDGAERHESLELALADGEEVGNCDRKHDGDVEQIFPVHSQRGEYLHQDDAQREGGGTLGDNTQVGSDRRGSSLIGIGSPEVEGNE